MVNLMIYRLVNWFIRRCEEHDKREKAAAKLEGRAPRLRILEITGNANFVGDIYLIRYYVFKSKLFNIFIHRFMRSDRDDLHDHPWDFVTYLVKGGYAEVRWNPKTNAEDRILRSNRPTSRENTFVYRRATDQHKVMVDRTFMYHERHKAPLTICITGRTKREWGFIRTWNDGIAVNGKVLVHNTREWVPWRKYLGLPDNAPGRG
jgi:hypothetical protein